jgi:5-methyltetrahydrofolate--homocysteine methyltransferase
MREMQKTGAFTVDNGHLEQLFNAVLEGEEEAVEETVRAALESGIPEGRILSAALIPAMTEAGRLLETKEFYLPEVLLAADAMKAGLALLSRGLGSAGNSSKGRVVLGAVQGDLHDIGKNLVSMMLVGAGFQVTDLGIDVPPHKFVEAALNGAEVIGMSAMLPTTIPNMQSAIDELKAAGVRRRVKVVVGGAILTQEHADRLGADGYAPDASAAVRKIEELISKSDATDDGDEQIKFSHETVNDIPVPLWNALSNEDNFA